jgi:hypothetical protein
MFDYSRTFTGSQLKFVHDVNRIEVTTHGQDGELDKKISFNPSQVAIARGGDTGYLQTEEGITFNGHVEFFSEEKVVNPVDPVGRTYNPDVPPAQPVPEIPGHVVAPPELNWSPRPVQQQDDYLEFTPGPVVPDVHVTGGSRKDDQPGPQDHSAQSVPQGFAPEVLRLVRERGDSYGSPAENHQLTADLWSAWMSRRLRKDIKFSAEDVCMLNCLQKQSRLAFKTKDDSWFDLAGYAENVAMIRPDQRNV